MQYTSVIECKRNVNRMQCKCNATATQTDIALDVNVTRIFLCPLLYIMVIYSLLKVSRYKLATACESELVFPVHPETLPTHPLLSGIRK